MGELRFLVVHPDPTVAARLRTALVSFRGAVQTAASWVEAERLQPGRFHLAFLPVGGNGADRVRAVRRRWPRLPIVVVYEKEDRKAAAACLAAGAAAAVAVPTNGRELVPTVRAVLGGSLVEVGLDVMHARNDGNGGGGLHALTTDAARLEAALAWTRAAEGKPLLILGPAGSEKGAVARTLHHGGARREQPFVILETRAGQNLLTLLAGAKGGTLFVEELAGLPQGFQALLAEVCRSGTYTDARGERHRADVQVIAASRRDPETEVRAGRLLAELVRAFGDRVLRLPPLAERREAIPQLAQEILRRCAAEEGLPAPQLTPAAAERLKSYRWPGNLRELTSVLERALLLAGEASTLDVQHLPPEIAGRGASIRPPGEIIPFIEEERAILKHALEVTGGKIPEAARRLHIGRATLYRKVKKYGLR